ncbi:MAG: aspartyl protease family protein [Phaeodactylibacter sp.]|nr:aspartyl protease family protein [Phaeodactylibacter sp.]MCB9291774.1 aspartyl protease family protein [Lewinellaceae bacterium]
MRWKIGKSMMMVAGASLLLNVCAHTQARYADNAYYAANKEALQLTKTSNFTIVPYELVRGMILVKAEIEGQSGNFILDTGAPTLIVNGDGIGERSAEWQSVSSDFNASTIRINKFNWAGIEKKGIEAIALDISHLEEAYQRKLLGIIGYQIFAGREILVNANTMQIFIFDGKKNYLSRVSKPITTLPFTMQDHLPVISARVGGQTYQFGFDSGCTANLLDQALLDKLPERAYNMLAQRQLQGFSEEPQDVMVIGTAAIELDNLPAKESEYLVTNLSHLKASDIHISGLLGYPFFKGLTFSINYVTRQLSIWEIHPEEVLP